MLEKSNSIFVFQPILFFRTLLRKKEPDTSYEALSRLLNIFRVFILLVFHQLANYNALIQRGFLLTNCQQKFENLDNDKKDFLLVKYKKQRIAVISIFQSNNWILTIQYFKLIRVLPINLSGLMKLLVSIHICSSYQPAVSTSSNPYKKEHPVKLNCTSAKKI